MRTPLQQSIARLEQVFDGQPWYGESVRTVLFEIPAETAETVREGRSVLRLVRHMTAWRRFVLARLRDDDDFEIEMNGPVDWPKDDAVSWPEALAELQKTQDELLAALHEFPETRLSEVVPGRRYRFVFMLEGIAQHDIYHLGQAALLAKLLVK